MAIFLIKKGTYDSLDIKNCFETYLVILNQKLDGMMKEQHAEIQVISKYHVTTKEIACTDNFELSLRNFCDIRHTFVKLLRVKFEVNVTKRTNKTTSIDCS